MTGTSDLQVGRVLAQGLEAVGRDPAGTLLPALLFGAIPSSLIGYALERVAPEVWYALGEMPGEFALACGAQVLGSVTNLLTQGAVTRAVLARSEGTRASLWATVRPALRRSPALVLAGLAIGIGTLLGGLLLLLPGLILFAAWSVTGPVLVEEGRGVLGSLRRSRDLARLAPAGVLGLNALLILGYVLFNAALFGAGFLAWNGSGADAVDAPLPVGFWIISALPVAVASAAWGAVVATLYASLRDDADGQPIDRLRRIFG